MKKSLTNLDKTVVDAVITKRIAALSLSGATTPEIMKELNLTRHAVEKVKNSPSFKELITEVGEKEFALVTQKAKSRIIKMSETALKVYEKVMQDYIEGEGNAREAVTVAQSVTRAIGIDKEGDKAQDANITIVMPSGVEQPITIEAEKE